MGQLVKAGLLLPLDNYAKAYGWTRRVSDNVRAVSSGPPTARSSAPATCSATRPWERSWASTTTSRCSSTWASRSRPRSASSSRTWTSRSGRARCRSSSATTTRSPGIHEYAVIQDQMASPSDLTDFIFGPRRTRSPSTRPRTCRPRTTLQDWATEGLLHAGVRRRAATTPRWPTSAKGQGLFMITGNWIVANLGADNRDFGFFLLPPVTAGRPRLDGRRGLPPGDHGGVRASRRRRRLHRLDDSDHASELLVQAGQIPLHAGAGRSSIEPGTVLADVDRRGVGGVEGQRRRSLRGLGHTDLLRHAHGGDPGADGHAAHPAGVRCPGREGLRRLPDVEDVMDASRRSLRREPSPSGATEPSAGRKPAPSASRGRRGGSATSTSRRRSSCTPRSTSCPLLQGANDSLFHWDGITVGTWVGPEQLQRVLHRSRHPGGYLHVLHPDRLLRVHADRHRPVPGGRAVAYPYPRPHGLPPAALPAARHHRRRHRASRGSGSTT